MQFVPILLPLAAFMLGYWRGGFYLATAALMVAMVLVVLIDYLWTRRVSKTHMLSTVLVLFLGSATLLLHNKLFVQLKPTVLMWLLALAFLGSQWIGRAPLAQRMLEPALEPGTNVPRASWLRINLAWVGAYLLLGALNLYVVRAASEHFWIYFKFIGLPIALAALTIGQALWLHRGHAADVEPHP